MKIDHGEMTFVNLPCRTRTTSLIVMPIMAQLIPYLIFADNCLIFCKAKVSRHVKPIENYCKVSGQLVNFHKSVIQFSERTKKRKNDYVVNVLQTPSPNSVGKLGCLNIDHKRTRRDFIKIKEQSSSKLRGLKASLFTSR